MVGFFYIWSLWSQPPTNCRFIRISCFRTTTWSCNPRHEEFNIKALVCSSSPTFILVQVMVSIWSLRLFCTDKLLTLEGWGPWLVLASSDPKLPSCDYSPITSYQTFLGAACQLRSLNTVLLNTLWLCSVRLLGNYFTHCYHYGNSLSMPYDYYYISLETMFVLCSRVYTYYLTFNQFPTACSTSKFPSFVTPLTSSYVAGKNIMIHRSIIKRV